MEMKWEVNDVFRLVVLIAAIIFFGVGIWMIFQAISAEGSIDIRSVIISGTLKTVSAGLFIVFLSFLLIVFSLIRDISKIFVRQPKAIEDKSSFKRSLHIFYILLVLFVLSILGYVFTEENARIVFAGTSFFLGFMMFIWIVVLINTLD